VNLLNSPIKHPGEAKAIGGSMPILEIQNCCMPDGVYCRRKLSHGKHLYFTSCIIACMDDSGNLPKHILHADSTSSRSWMKDIKGSAGRLIAFLKSFLGMLAAKGESHRT
jgi:hypothetical protein